ncbi:hypothetical protein [Halobaculum sp. EA56]|uniref:hypothetical protein n=1 Tax=Halobaculum sp. EA56 TaxID=3421648 RepID=UPI003EBFFD2C
MHVLSLPVAVSLALLVANGLGMSAYADEPGHPHHETTLTDNESAALRSDDPDKGTYQGTSPYEHLTATVDITYRAPPDTAARWSTAAFEHLDGRDPETAVLPEHAAVESGRYLEDAHITLYGVYPSTRVHRAETDTPLYVAPEGSVRAFVDYRVDMPDRTTEGNTTRTWTLADHRIVETRLHANDRVIGSGGATHTPVWEFDELSETPVLTVSATIAIRVRVSERTKRTVCRTPTERGPDVPADHPVGTAPRIRAPPNSTSEAEDPTTTCRVIVEHTTRAKTERITVRDEIDVVVSDPDPEISAVRYPNEDLRVRLATDEPWRALVTDEGVIRTRWRFYTAGDRRWERLERRSRSGTRTVESELAPVNVHAFASVIDPGSNPPNSHSVEYSEGTTVTPPTTLGTNVHVDHRTDPYWSTDDIRFRTQPESTLRIHGIVRGVAEPLERPSTESVREIRPTTTHAEVVNEPKGGATIEVTVRDAWSGDTVASYLPLDDMGYVDVAGHRVPLDSTGSGRIWVPDPGSYTATYHPPSDTSVQQFAPSTDTVRWHPLHDPDALGRIADELGPLVIPASVAVLVWRWTNSPARDSRRW